MDLLDTNNPNQYHELQSLKYSSLIDNTHTNKTELTEKADVKVNRKSGWTELKGEGERCEGCEGGGGVREGGVREGGGV